MKPLLVVVFLISVSSFAKDVPMASFRKDCEDKIYTPRFCGDMAFFTATGCNSVCASAFQDAKKLDEKYRALMAEECTGQGGKIRWEISQPEPGHNKCGDIKSVVKTYHWHRLSGKGKCECSSASSSDEG